MRILAVGDIHTPCERDGYLEFCQDVYNSWDCEKVVFVGDVVDMHNASQYETEADAPGAKDECDMAAERIALWHSAFPNALVCEGNHDDRVNRAARRSNIPRARFLRSYAEAWDTPTWKWDYEHTIDGVYYFHGDGYAGLHPAYNASKQMAMSVVMGHIHTAGGIKWHANPNQRWFGMDVGCGIDDRKYAFYYGKRMRRKSILSCGVVIDGHPYHEMMPLEDY
jgi:predicted phosphodiesterase